MAIDDDDLDRLWHAVFGNGAEGMDEMIRKNTTSIAAIQAAGVRTNAKLDALKTSIDDLAQERRDDNARREGSKATLNWIRWGLGVLAILITLGGALGLTTLLDTLGTVSQQLNRIPPLPE